MNEETYPGKRLGLPEDGPGSVATWLARVAALFVDWFASTLVARLLISDSVLPPQFATLAVFVLESALFVALARGSFGQVILRLAVVRLDGRPVNLLEALLRQALVSLVIPPLVFNPDNRGLHDLVVKTVVVRR